MWECPFSALRKVALTFYPSVCSSHWLTFFWFIRHCSLVLRRQPKQRKDAKQLKWILRSFMLWKSLDGSIGYALAYCHRHFCDEHFGFHLVLQAEVLKNLLQLHPPWAGGLWLFDRHNKHSVFPCFCIRRSTIQYAQWLSSLDAHSRTGPGDFNLLSYSFDHSRKVHGDHDTIQTP